MAEALTIWHNPRCGKSRDALALLRAAGHAPTIRLYLEDPPGLAELRAAVAALGLPARALARSQDPDWTLTPDEMNDDETVLAVLVREPRLIERPLILSGGRAVIGRPPERALALLSDP